MTAAFAYAQADVYEAIEALRLDIQGIRVKLDRALGLIPAEPLRKPLRLLNKPETEIVAVVAVHYHLAPEDLMQHTLAYRISRPRHVAMYLMRLLLGYSYPQCARALGKFHHTTVMHGCQEIKRRRASDPAFDAEVTKLIERLK